MKYCVLIFSIFIAVLSNLAFAEVNVIRLPGDYADFALHPETGDVVALSAENNKALLFREASEKQEPAKEIKVGSTPCSICFKTFGEMSVYAVVCSQDSHMYVIDAEKFELLKKIELEHAGVSFVTSSLSKKDPFIYCSYGSGHDSATGVVSLRDMKNHGAAFDDSMDCAISADGNLAYRRGPWSPSGFEALILTNDLADKKPAFARLFYDHKSTAQYIPDLFNRFTVTGKEIYTASLEKKEATCNFLPQCFFRTRPILIGASGDDERRSRGAKQNEVTFQAASYNTFSNVGDQVSVTLETAKDEGNLPRGVSGQADFKRVAKRIRFFADDKRDRLVYASRQHLVYVPLTEFNLPDEAFLHAELEGPKEFEVGKVQPVVIRLKDERATFDIEDYPEGMEIDGANLNWTPAADQIGEESLVLTLKHADVQRTIRFQLPVKYPSIKLPFAPASISADADAKRVVIWEGLKNDQFGRPVESNSTPRIAVIDAESGETLAERKLGDTISTVVVSNQRILLQTVNAASRIEVLNLTDLERVKSITFADAIQGISRTQELLVISTSGGTEILNANTLERMRVPGNAPSTPARTSRMMRQHYGQGSTAGMVVAREGLFANGVLYDHELKTKLIVQPTNLIELPGADTRLKQTTFLHPVDATIQQQPRMGSFGSGGTTRIASRQLPGTNVQVSLDQSMKQMQVSGATHTWKTSFELVLTASGSVDERQVLIRRNLHAQTSGMQRTAQPVLQVASRQALVAYEDELFLWHVDTTDSKKAGDENNESLDFVYEQSSLKLSGEGTTVLKHQTSGGKQPLEFSLLTPYEDAISIDKETGNVTIDEQRLMLIGQNVLQDKIIREGGGDSYTDTFRQMALPMIEAGTAILGERPKGPLVAVPIRLDVSDSNFATKSLQYFVLAEIPSAPLMAKLHELDKQRKSKVIEAEAQRLAAMEASRNDPTGAKEDPEGSDSGYDPSNKEVLRRLDALEQRLDLLTRQLNQLLKKETGEE